MRVRHQNDRAFFAQFFTLVFCLLVLNVHFLKSNRLIALSLIFPKMVLRLLRGEEEVVVQDFVGKLYLIAKFKLNFLI